MTAFCEERACFVCKDMCLQLERLVQMPAGLAVCWHMLCMYVQGLAESW